MPANWNGPIGPVVLIGNRGSKWSYGSIALAAMDIRRYRFDMSEHPLPSVDVGLGLWPIMSRHVLVDASGLIIPLWRIEREIADLGPPAQPYWYRRYANYKPERDFRKTPLAGTGGRRRYGRYLRHMKTLGELRENLGFEADLRDQEDFPVRVKIRARRKTLPTLWDDVPHARKGDGWKNYRKTQFRD